MDDLKSVTVSYLRDLARKHLGPGYSKLNKTELIAALAGFVPAVKKLAQLAGIPVPSQAKAASKSAAASARPSREARSAEKKPERKQESEKKAPVKKKEPERKKEPEGKKVPEKKDPEGKKGPQKKEPEAKKGPEKKAAEKKEPEKKAAAPQEPKAAAPQKPKAAAPQEPKAAAPQEPKPAPQAPKAAAPQEPKAAAPQEPKAAAPQDRKQERKPTSGRSVAAKAEELSQSLRHAQVVNFPPRPRSYRSAEEAWKEDAADLQGERPEGAPSRPAEPLLEGFFVARMVGERELRRHHLTEDQAPRAVTSNATGYEENLGELPVDYASDVAMALARDPHTLFISWDFSPATLAKAKDGLDSPRPVLRVYEGDRVVRLEEFAIESRSFYIHGLPPGRSYRVEAHFVGRDGRSRRIGPSTHPVVLPHDGLSEDTMVRFMRMPPPPPPTLIVAPQPVVAPPEPTQETLFEEREFITWNRVPLPGSADVAAVLERRRDRILREAPPAGPEAPGGALPPHLEVSARPLGSSEQSAARGQHLGGASELLAARGQHLGGASELLVARGQHLGGASELLAARGQHLGGASELAAARGLRFSGASEHSADRGQGGASEQIHWTPPPSGRGR